MSVLSMTGRDTMSKKDYILIAGVMKDFHSRLERRDISSEWNESFIDGNRNAHGKISEMLAETLALENTRFDKKRFLQACGEQVL